ncbi:MAG: hypothetical protein KDD61_01165 [Bdellovibrionales bacterium]|nr:hypothetical protein [Bdellovibrionales bacterium]
MLKLWSPDEVIKNPQMGFGGKAIELSKLEERGVLVPEWKVISWKDIELFYQLRNQEGDVDTFTQELRSWVHVKHEESPKVQFIVRSSANCEDGAKSSFAGQFESIGNLRTIDEIVAAMDSVWKSATSDGVLKYCRVQNFDPQNIKMSIIVQVMVTADVSGVLFTADPKDGSRTRFLISAIRGGCHAVVDGSGDSDEYEVELPDGEVRWSNSSQTVRLPITEQNLQKAESAFLNEEAVLHKEQILKLVDVGKRLTERDGRPLDIEWLMKDSRLYIVQSRPITSIGLDLSEQRTFCFDNSNIQESFNGQTLPLTFSFAVEAYHRVYRQLMEVMGFSGQEVRAHDERHMKMLALVNGRVYYNILSWYEGLLFLPSFGRHKEDMENMMGVENPVSFVEDQVLTFREKLKVSLPLVKSVVRLLWSFRKLDTKAAQFQENFMKVYCEFPRKELQWMKLHHLLDLQLNLKQKVLEQWHVPIINDFYVMLTSGQVRRVLAKVELSDRLSDLLAGEELESVQPTRELIKISDKLKEHSELVALILKTDGPIQLILERHGHGLENLLDSYIHKYGDRVAGELKLETKTLFQDTTFMDQVLRGYLKNSDISLVNFDQRQGDLRKKSEQEVFQVISQKLGSWPLRRFRRSLKAFRKGVRLREAMRLNRTQSFGMFRAIYMSIGKKLFEQGWIHQPEDVFYLTTTEVSDFLNGKSLFDSPKELVNLRKKTYVRWKEERPQGSMEVSLPIKRVPLVGDIVDKVSADLLQGLGCYPGVVRGEVVRVSDPRSLPCDLSGKILVAERTDPGWTPLFLQIKGLIVERGSQLSHSAVVAREMGLPTIVGVTGIFDLLQTGSCVEIDGRLGTVKVLKEEWVSTL